ncbi:MAG: HTH-type transcriptional activator IlvY [Gammaproteobacteria bacterium]|nr:HTH-type transcriptional activator IlvY [Gammaproteobacteria bacterium]MBU1554100.1 HTH-type transcriptional activator IlvY [Gammaproteobacteria bacterium]MBU2068908.1 HTH-type transcriptional activator IlvY [Gammaproteobacteria bacterium]MBU2181415.1 HTH-type transcriptional activator IlvY [Gammaproteobacteria bacterium]MBU2203839.1 HTH-type transcriptional activator IlvY [Gammaproteobacteria bacterium]
MDIRSAQLFQHLASSLNFSKTSEQMYVSAPTLTRVIQRLEQELGAELFFRDKRSVRLTPAGQRFAGFVRNWLDEWHQLQIDLQLASAELSGEIRLFCTVTASYSHLPAILDRFRLSCPKAEIKLTTGDAASAIEKVRLDEVDIALAAHPAYLPANLAFRSIANLPVMLIAPTIPCKVNDLLQQQPIPWHKIPLIMPEHGPARSRFDRWLQDMAISPQVVAKVDGHEAMVSMVALGTGVALVADAVVSNSPVKDRVRTLKLDYRFEPFDLGVCMLNKRLHEPLIKAFWQLATAKN